MPAYEYDTPTVAQVVSEVLDRIEREDDLDFVWTHADRMAMLTTLRSHFTRLVAGDDSSVGDLRWLFAPTGVLGEVRGSAEWDACYHRAADYFDHWPPHR